MATKSPNHSGATSARTAARPDPATAKDTADEYYPGQRFGLPEQGRGSVASISRRVVALFIDWLLCMVIAYWLTHSQFWTIAIFAVEVFLLTALGGSTLGKRLVGIRTIGMEGGPVGFRRSLLRTIVLLTFVLPLFTDSDRMGLHDRAARTIVVRI